MMPSFRQKFVGFIRQLSNSSESARDNDVPENPSDCFIQNYLKGSEKANKNEPVILHGKKPYEIPPLNIGDYETAEVKAADTGPDGGLVTVNKKKDPNANNTIAGTDNWANPHLWACGQSCSLYEVHPVTQLRAGDPIADCYGLLVREDTAILCLADGVNWGVKASVAAKAAVHGCIDYLNTHLFCDASPKPSSTTEVFATLLRSFHSAHTLILQEKGMLTTLTAAVILPLQNEPGQYVVCTCNVGDSLAYVFSPKHGVREITQGSHDVHQMRDMRDALGALGPVDGQNPELSNLTLSLTQVETGDIVFLTSDGVSDNLDPVVGKFTGLPTVEAHQRHKLLLLRTEDLLRYGVSGKGPSVASARDTVSLLLDFVTRLTAAKRHILEDKDLYNTGPEGTLMSPGEQVSRRREICKRLHAIPGKLDHASVAAYVVGKFSRVADLASEDHRVYEEVEECVHLNKEVEDSARLNKEVKESVHLKEVNDSVRLNIEVKENVQSNEDVESACSDGEKTRDMVSKDSSMLDKDATEDFQKDISEAFNKNTKILDENILNKSSEEVNGKEKKYVDTIDVSSSEEESSETGGALNVERSDVDSLVFIDGESDEETVKDGKESGKEIDNSNETVNESDVQNNNRLEGKENRSHSKAKTAKQTGERVERSGMKSDASTGSSVSNKDRTSNGNKAQDKRDRRAKDRRTRRKKDNPSKEN